MAKIGNKRAGNGCGDGDFFQLTLKLDCEPWQKDILASRLRACRQVSNALTSLAQRRWNYLSRDKKFLASRQELIEYNQKIAARKGKKTLEEKEKQAELYARHHAFLAPLNLDSEFAFHREVTRMYQHFGVPSAIAQKLATAVYGGLVDLMDGKADELHFKRHYEPFSIEGKTNRQNLTLRRAGDGFTVNVFGLKLGAIVRSSDVYARQALENFDRIRYCRLLYCPVDGYYAQIVFPGAPPTKKRKAAPKGSKGGLDIGTQTVGYHGEQLTLLDVLCPGADKQEAEIRRLSRALDRSRRANNPDNYNADGTIRPGRHKWHQSNRYITKRTELTRLKKRQAGQRRYEHTTLANRIASDAETVFVEPMGFAGLAKRGVTVDDKGNPIKRGRFGKSIANRAPATFIAILAWALKLRGGQLLEVDSSSLKASQYNHLANSFNKKPLSQRWSSLHGRAGPVRVQRDLYSGFLLKHTNPDLATYDRAGMINEFDSFARKHDREIARLENAERRLPSSIGIRQ